MITSGKVLQVRDKVQFERLVASWDNLEEWAQDGQRDIVDSICTQYDKSEFVSGKQIDLIKNICEQVEDFLDKYGSLSYRDMQ